MGEKKNKVSQKIFIETSVFIRFLTYDNPKKAEECRTLFDHVENGILRPYTSSIVIAEIVFVLSRLYHFESAKVYEAIQKILDLRNLTLIEKSDTRSALESWRKFKIKYGDCLIRTQIPTSVTLVTYDKDFQYFADVRVCTPADLLSI